MSFSLTSTDITLNLANAILSANCENESGHFIPSQIDLNEYLGNINGSFQWGYKGWLSTAKDVKLNYVTIQALLEQNDGNYLPANVDLDAYIANVNGVLTYNGPTY